MPIPDTSAPPRTLDAWLHCLDATCPPISERQREQLRQELQRSDRPLWAIAQRLQSSPAFTLALLREANRQPPGPLGGPVEHIESALTRLGLDRAEVILKALPQRSASTLPASLVQLLLISQHAQHQAAGLFATRMPRLANEIHCASLLFLAPFWAIAQAFPDLPQRWAARVVGERQAAHVVERDLFGVPLLDLALALARRWRLPEGVILGYQALRHEREPLIRCLRLARRPGVKPLERLQETDPQLLRWLTRPTQSALLVNALVVSAHHAWDDRRSLRWQRITALYLGTPLDRLQRKFTNWQRTAPACWQPAPPGTLLKPCSGQPAAGARQHPSHPLCFPASSGQKNGAAYVKASPNNPVPSPTCPTCWPAPPKR